MHVGTPLFILLTSSRFHRLILPIPLNRQRKVKCHQLPGQPKVCLYPLTHLIFSTNRFRPIPSARYSTPLPCLTTDSSFHTQHCMVKNYPCTSVFCLFLSLVAELTSACSDTTHSKLPAKRSGSQLSADVLARTLQALNKGLCSSFSLFVLAYK